MDHIFVILKTKYGVNPLAVTVRAPIELGLGIQNLHNFVNNGYNHIHITPDKYCHSN